MRLEDLGVNHLYRGTNYFCFLARFAQFDGMEPKKMQEQKHSFWVDLRRIDISSVAVMAAGPGKWLIVPDHLIACYSLAFHQKRLLDE